MSKELSYGELTRIFSREPYKFSSSQNKKNRTNIAWISCELIDKFPLPENIPVMLWWDRWVLAFKNEDGKFETEDGELPFESEMPPTHFHPLLIPPYEAILEQVKKWDQELLDAPEKIA